MIVGYDSLFPKIHGTCFVAESSDLIGEIEIGEDSSIWYNTVIRADGDKCIIGKDTNIQDGAIIHVDVGLPTIIGDGVTVGHGAIVHACTVGNNVLVGMGAIILDNAKIEDNVIIGAGALVPQGKVIASGSLVIGSPGRIVRSLSEEEIENIKKSAKHYVELSKKYLE